MSLFDAFKKQEVPSSGVYKEESFDVVGMKYYMKNVHRLARFNRDYWLTGKSLASSGVCGEKIFKNFYVNKPVKLVQESHNKHDKNAVAVHICGKLVGYIPADDAAHVRTILSKYRVRTISSFIGGGKYKIVGSNGSVVKMENNLFIRVTVGYEK